MLGVVRAKAFRWTALVVGLLLIGASLSYVFAPRSGGNDSPVLLSADALAEGAGGASMPSVLGLSQEIARSALADRGLSGVDVSVSEKPAAGPAGTVLEQTPGAGKAVTDTVALVISTTVTMPNLVGKPQNEARATLENMGAVVDVVTRVDPAVTAGAVLDSDPAPGKSTPSVVILTVADPGDALSLSTVDRVESSSCSTSSSTSVNGTTLANNVTCTPSRSDPAVAEYALARNATQFEATVGTDDQQGSGNAVVTIRGDGRVLKTVPVGLGRSAPVQVDVRNVLRLQITVTTDATDDQEPNVVLGDARLRGTTEGLNQIANR